MPLVFAAPNVLLAAPTALLALAWLTRAGFRLPARGALTATVLLTLVLAGAQPIWVHPRPSPIVVLEDVSASHRWATAGTTSDPIALAPGVPVVHLPFARAQGARATAGQNAFAGTDIEAALRAARAAVAPSPCRIVLVSDGRQTAGDAHAYSAVLADQRSPIIVWPVPQQQESPDAAVVALTAPPWVTARAPFELRTQVEATTAGVRRLQLLRDGTPAPLQPEQPVPLRAGRTTVVWRTRLDEDAPARFEARLTGAPDAQPGNDAAPLVVAPRTGLHVMLMGPSEDETRALAAALSASGVQVKRVWPPSREVAAALSGTDVLVIANAPRAAFDDALLRAVDGWVNDGGGLIFGGGPSSYGVGGWQNAPSATLLPVTMEGRTETEEPTLALALVIDRSGSMAGPKLELTKEAARAAIVGLAPGDLGGVIAFDTRARTVARLQPLAGRQRLLAEIGALRASGGTNIVPALREAVDQMLAVSAQKKHVILLSDGQSQREGLDELVDEAAAGRVSVSTIAVGDGADQALLASVADRTGGRAYFTADPTSIPRLFSRETETLRRKAPLDSDVNLREAKTSDVLAGIDFTRAPTLRGRNPARLRRTAEALLADASGQPVLARWHVGLGTVISWASDFGPRWAGAFVRWSAFPRFALQLVRSAAEGRVPPDGWHVSAAWREGAVTVQAHAPEPVGGPPQEPTAWGLNVVGSLRPWEGGAAQPLPFTEVTPGVYRAVAWPAFARSAVLRVEVRVREGGLAQARGETVVAMPWSPELWPATPEARARAEARLTELATMSGGARLTAARELPKALQAAETALVSRYADAMLERTPLATPLLTFAALLFLADVAVRRAKVLASR